MAAGQQEKLEYLRFRLLQDWDIRLFAKDGLTEFPKRYTVFHCVVQKRYGS